MTDRGKSADAPPRGRSADREFDDAQVSRILERAAEQQKQAERGALVRRRGTSLTQLEEIASEVGIEPRFVRAAALEVEVGADAEEPKTILGIPERIGEVRVIPSGIDDTSWGRIVEELRTTFGSHGVTSQFGEVREWASMATTQRDSLVTRVRLEPTGDGETLIRIDQNLRQLMLLPAVLAGTFASTVVVFLVLGLVLGMEPGMFAVSGLLTLLAALTGGIGLALSGRSADRRERQLRSAVDRIDLIARSGAGR